jgi:hypothetical protein
MEESMYFTQLPQTQTIRILPQNTTHLAALGHFSWNTTRRKGRGDAGWLENVVGRLNQSANSSRHTIGFDS